MEDKAGSSRLKLLVVTSTLRKQREMNAGAEKARRREGGVTWGDTGVAVRRLALWIICPGIKVMGENRS